MSAPDDLVGRVAELEAENARLKEDVRLLTFFHPDAERAEKAEAERDTYHQLASRNARLMAETLTERVEQASEIDDLKAERDALRADAERYRWLRDGAECNADVSVKVKGELYYGPAHSQIGAELDAAIDAARVKP